MKIKDLKTGQIYRCKLSGRKVLIIDTKCNIWLAREMGMSTTECKIKLLSEPELEKAYKICEQGIKEAKRKSIY